MEFRILGTLEVVADDQCIELGGGRQRALLAMLLIRANELVSADRLIDEFWHQSPPEGATNALHASVSRLRRVLGPALSSDSSAALRTTPPGYVLEVAPSTIDAQRFERLAIEGRRSLATGEKRRDRGERRPGHLRGSARGA